MKFIDIVLHATAILLILFLAVLVHDFRQLKTRPAPAIQPPQPLIYQVPNQDRLGIVRLLRGKQTVCTGSVVNDTTVITAGHCASVDTPFGPLPNPDAIEVRAPDNIARHTYGRVHSIDPQLDHAILRGNFKTYNKFVVVDDIDTLQSLRDPRIKFLACGYPLNGPLHCQVVTYRELYNFMWEVNGLLLPGMSGGPVLAPNGTIIGTNTAVSGGSSIVSPTYNITKGF